MAIMDPNLIKYKLRVLKNTESYILNNISWITVSNGLMITLVQTLPVLVKHPLDGLAVNRTSQPVERESHAGPIDILLPVSAKKNNGDVFLHSDSVHYSKSPTLRGNGMKKTTGIWSLRLWGIPHFDR
jgi:hypothetical protein